MTALLSHVLSTDELAVQVVPQLGGRITELTDLRRGRQWLWRNHRVPIGPSTTGADYDSVWQGGFEELFPNDAPTTLNDLVLPDHGELWSMPWEVEHVDSDSMRLGTVGAITGIPVSKTVSVEGATMRINYELNNTLAQPFPHLFKLHPAFSIDDACRIDLPGGLVEKVEPDFGNLWSSSEPAPWPTPVDLSECRPESSGTNEFVYVSGLPQGRCGIVDTRVGARVDVFYPDDLFPYCWIFMSYGGWREHNVVVLEPCTNYPKDLHEAIAHGTSGILEPGEQLDFEVAITVGAMNE